LLTINWKVFTNCVNLKKIKCYENERLTSFGRNLGTNYMFYLIICREKFKLIRQMKLKMD